MVSIIDEHTRECLAIRVAKLKGVDGPMRGPGRLGPAAQGTKPERSQQMGESLRGLGSESERLAGDLDSQPATLLPVSPWKSGVLACDSWVLCYTVGAHQEQQLAGTLPPVQLAPVP